MTGGRGSVWRSRVVCVSVCVCVNEENQSS